MSIYNDGEVIAALLLYINQYTGLDLRADGYFKGIKTHKGKKYFNVELQQKTSESIEYNQLERLIALSYGTITNVEPNGMRRAAVFFDANKLHLCTAQ